ncbi:MAG TPA: helix-turn-helix transcriptional regulator [Pseudonocardiaceae bacterium]|jgi:transcriptional regulator with XRE-family HTH domain|nr:helix-turn-helix transcriptional regulator [Pseudonocardiaceae bacterium]
MDGTTGTPRARALGAALRKAREDAGLGLREFARKMNLPHANLVRWEAGTRAPKPEDVATLLATLNIDGAERHRLLELAHDATAPNWYGVGISEKLAALLEFERTATRIVDVSPLLVPGLLQTADYTRAVMQGGGSVPANEIETRVAVRMGRQHALTRRDPVQYSALIGEQPLRHGFVSNEVQAEQLRNIIRLAELPNVTVRVLPFAAGWTPALEGASMLFEFAGGGPIVYLEHHQASGFVHDQRDVAGFFNSATTIQDATLGPIESIAFIDDLATEMEGQTP